MHVRAATSWRLVARVVPVLLVGACGGDAPRVPTTLAPPSNFVTTGTVATPIATVPTVTVTDQKGRGLAGVWVKWTIGSGGGKVTNDSSRTDGAGTASSGGWTLGTAVGVQTLRATADKLSPTTFTAQATAGPLVSLVQSGGAATGVVNTPVQVPPTVRAFDQYGNPIAGVPVTFVVATGGGTVTGAQQTTNSDGIATVTSWTLGTPAGDQSLRALVSTANVSTVLYARAVGGPGVDLVLVDGNAQQGYGGKRLCTSPSVRLVDAFGNKSAQQVPVAFTVVSGSGRVKTLTVQSNTDGVAADEWTLGTTGTQTLIATTSALPGKQVSFSATLKPDAAPGYTICAIFLGDGGTDRQREAVTKAVARWQSVIVGHTQTTHLSAPANECTAGIPAIDEDVEDLRLYVQLAPIDGPLAILGQASPCYVHVPANLTLMGFLQLDTADLDLLLADGTLDNVVLHEIGHILGIGTLWNLSLQNVLVHQLLSGAGGSDPYFSGDAARNAFSLTGSVYGGTPVPVENLGGAGTRDSHWRKSIFNTELMQGYAAKSMPLSRVTIGSLADLGYQVNLSAADPFSLLPSLRSAADAPGRELPNDVSDVPIRGVAKDGTHTLLRAPAASVRNR